jgi:hypothetical protein
MEMSRFRLGKTKLFGVFTLSGLMGLNIPLISVTT